MNLVCFTILIGRYGYQLPNDDYSIPKIAFIHTGCNELYNGLLEDGYIIEIDNGSDTIAITTRELLQKFKLNVEHINENLYEKK